MIYRASVVVFRRCRGKAKQKQYERGVRLISQRRRSAQEKPWKKILKEKAVFPSLQVSEQGRRGLRSGLLHCRFASLCLRLAVELLVGISSVRESSTATEKPSGVHLNGR